MNQQKTILLFALMLWGTAAFCGDLKLWYQQPALAWTEGLPIGNGKLMGMVQGGTDHEKIQLNEETVWTGGHMERDRPGAWKHLAEVRQLMFDGKYWEAEQLVKAKMNGLRLPIGVHTYQELGNIDLKFKYPNSAEITDYRRELDLETAIVKISYKKGGVTYTREVFSSPADNAMIVHLSCDKPGHLSFDVGLSRKGAKIETLYKNRISMSGTAISEQVTGWPGVDFEGQLEVHTSNGIVARSDKGLHIEKATEVTMRLVAATNYYGDVPKTKCEELLKAIESKSYEALKSTHINEHQRLFNRVDLDLGTTENAKLPTDKRLEAFRNGASDPQLLELYFQYGRYLLMSASRPGSMAISLWGKWVQGLAPAYDADYHININIQMNYWLAEMCNLSECHEPFIDLIDSLRVNGRKTARETYNARGFTAHYATDAWFYTALQGNPPYATWPMAPAWGCQHMWEHYLFGRNKEYLRNTSYPIMKEACQFFFDYLVEHPKYGYLVTGPSTSPENRFVAPDGKVVSLSMAPTMDNQLVFDLFSNTIKASRVLNVDADFRAELEKRKARLMPMQIGNDGRLQEWAEPFQENDKGHRHISHLWGLCPGNQITEETPELFEAARKSLDVRVENGAADSPEYQGIAAWVTCSYVRLMDAEKAYQQISKILAKSSWDNLFAVGERGRTREMFETDVNFGVTSAIAEMLLQSHAGCVHLLPALPKELSTGRVKGLKARGGFEFDLVWTDGRLQRFTIKSLEGLPCLLRYGDETYQLYTEQGGTYHFDAGVFSSVE